MAMRGERALNLDGLKLRDLAPWLEIEAFCRVCLHHSELTVEQLSRSRSPETPLRHVENKLRCTKCMAVGWGTLTIRPMPR
jgi:hypothetical protein